LFQLLFGGKYPFLADDLETLTNHVTNQELYFPPSDSNPSNLREDMKMVVEKLLKKDPEQRMTSMELNTVFLGFRAHLGE